MTDEQRTTRNLLVAAGWTCALVWPEYLHNSRALFRRPVGGIFEWCEVSRDGSIVIPHAQEAE